MNIEFSALAAFKLNQLLIFLESEWSVKVKLDFIQLLDDKLLQLRRFPDSAVKTAFNENIRKALVTHHSSLYYLVMNNTIYVLTIEDNRQDPRAIAELLEKNFSEHF